METKANKSWSVLIRFPYLLHTSASKPHCSNCKAMSSKLTWASSDLSCLYSVAWLTDPPALPKCHLYQHRKCQRRPEQLTAIILVHLIQNLKKQRTFCKKLHLWCSTPNCYWVFWSARFISESTESAVSFSIPDQFHLSKPSEFGTAAREVASAHDIFALFILRFLFQCCSKWRKSGTATNVVIHRSLRLEPGRAFFGAFQTVPKFPLHVTNGVRVDVSKHEWLQFQRKIRTSQSHPHSASTFWKLRCEASIDGPVVGNRRGQQKTWKLSTK